MILLVGGMKEILNKQVHLYAVILLLLATAGGIMAFAVYFREVIYNYKLYVPAAASSSAPVAGLQYGAWPALSNPDFFGAVRNNFIAEKATFIEADLSNMKLRFYKEGAVLKEYSILAKGKVGSWWETPAGLYKISVKQKKHFSTFGRVYQPYSMVFQGNFFIHGWPYYPDGTPVASTYSGGCIRLSTDDAAELYDMANAGTPVLVYENGLAHDDFAYQFKIPEISAKDYLAADLKNDFVFLRKNETEKTPIASLTKLITAMVATEYINLDDSIAVTKEMIVPTSKPRLTEGENISAFQLLFPLLMESSNEAAAAFSESLGNERFVSLMNDKAGSLGMKDTAFVDAAGSGAGNISTAEDIFILVKNILNNRGLIFKITAGKIKDTAYGNLEFKDLGNFNVFEDDPDFIGGKVGETAAAGQTIVSLFNFNFNGETRPVAIIALGSEDRAKDVQSIRDYIENNYLELRGPGDGAASL
jgi:serine-type D-Ala-D-Ala carboxypeptidase (penicillin-binding protein 5/6)